MERIYALVEQLDLALDQLAVGTPAASRFALILIDNAIELVLHASCENEVLMDDARPRWLPKRYAAKARDAALGQRFSPKVEFCFTLGMLSREEAEFIRNVHEYRNELYHTGIRYDAVILPLAWEYFGVAAQLLPKIRLGAYLLVDTESPRVAKHFPGDMWSKPPDERIPEAAAHLLAARPPLSQPFAILLSDFATGLVERVEGNLEFLATDNPNGLNEQQILFEVQLNHYAFDAVDGPQLADATLPPGVTVFQRLDELRTTWQPEFGTSPVSRWKERAAAIRHASDSYEALARFQALRRDMEDLSTLLEDAARSLDAAIQLEIDRYRGK